MKSTNFDQTFNEDNLRHDTSVCSKSEEREKKFD
jgi:hypothetical protein